MTSLSFRVQAAGLNFDSPIKLGPGFNPNIQAVGSNVYAAWTDKSGGILFKESSNDGQTWGSLEKIGNGGNYPIMSASGSYVYVAWSAGGILFSASSNYGAVGSWSKPIRISSGSAITPYVASSGKLVSVVYYVNNVGSFVTSSTNNGTTWTKPFEYSNGPEDQVAISGSNIYIMADDVYRTHAQFGVSHDSGQTWKVNSSGLPPGSEEWLVATGPDLYAVWETKTPHSVIWFMNSSDYGDTLSTKIISNSIPDAWNPMIDAIGNNVWVGIQEFGSEAQNWMLTSTNGGSTFTAQSLSPGHVGGFIFSIPTSDGSDVFTMWIQGSGTNNQAMVGYSSNGGSWSTTSLGRSDPNSDVAIGDIASDGVHGFATWQYNSTIYFAAS
jgi:hypothetical protein